MLIRKVALERLKAAGLVAVLEGMPRAQVLLCVKALLAGGVDAIELSVLGPDSLRVFRELRATYLGRLCLGAGGVFNADLAALAVGLDVDFISSPNADPLIVDVCRARDVLACPAALTPTEVMRVWHSGADLIKVMPASALGPEYVAHLKRHYPPVELIPSGGVKEANVASFVWAGAGAVMIGHGLCAPELLAQGDYPAVTARAQRVVALISAARQEAAPAGCLHRAAA
jgi:2-dehydro-3-deoxyphosphogluconate aldolase/(4S)-4-hydroxy-2-oxoglutarate aldolase